MNKSRRAKINKLLEELEYINSEIESIKCDEQDAYDNLPESIQGSDRGQQMEEYVDSLDEAWESMQSAIDTLTEIAEG